MAQALRNSLVTAGIGKQETGVLNSTASGGFDFVPVAPQVDGVQFGPANRNEAEYDHDEWALVRSGTIRTTEVFNDPDDPADRRREEGTPAFLKPAPDDSRLGALLTMFHEIPILRELLLRRDHSATEYGYDNEWWTNGKIEVPQLLIDPQLEGDLMEGVSQSHDLTEELQRIMAFLDKTERSYGSVENVVRLILEKYPGTDAIVTFFEEWEETWDDAARNRFLSVAFQPLARPLPEQFMFLPVGESIVQESENLYDCLDSLLWPSDWPEAGIELEQSPYLGQLGEAVCFQLRGKKQSKSMDIPMVWYPDRYLALNREAALEIRRQQNEIRQKIAKMDVLKNKLATFTKNGKSHKVRDLIFASLTHDNRENPLTEDHIQAEPETKIEEEDPEKQAALNHLSEQLQQTMANIDKKLASLEKEKEKAQASLRELSEFYNQAGEKIHKYTLRGISTSGTTTFINRIEFSESGTEMSVDTDYPKEQWWRITFDGQGQCPFSIYTVEEKDVIEAARESQEPLLVYASEKAIQPCFAPLSDKLSAFVDKDNEVFRAEIPSMKSLPEESHFDNNWPVPQSPGKRKYNSDGQEVEDEYRVSPGRRGSMDVNFDSADRDPSPGRSSFSMDFSQPATEMVERSRPPNMLGSASASNNESSMDVDEVVRDMDAGNHKAWGNTEW